MTPKPWYQSKTVWFNGLTALIVIATFFGFVPNQELAGQISTALIALAPFINLFLRFITKQPIAIVPPPPQQ